MRRLQRTQLGKKLEWVEKQKERDEKKKKKEAEKRMRENIYSSYLAVYGVPTPCLR